MAHTAFSAMLGDPSHFFLSSAVMDSATSCNVIAYLVEAVGQRKEGSDQHKLLVDGMFPF